MYYKPGDIVKCNHRIIRYFLFIGKNFDFEPDDLGSDEYTAVVYLGSSQPDEKNYFDVLTEAYWTLRNHSLANKIPKHIQKNINAWKMMQVLDR